MKDYHYMRQTTRLLILIIFTNGFLVYTSEKEQNRILLSQIAAGLYSDLNKAFVRFQNDYASIQKDIQNKKSLPYERVVEQYGKLFILAAGITSRQTHASGLLSPMPLDLRTLYTQFQASISDLQKAMIVAYRPHRLHMIASWDEFNNIPIWKGEQSPIKGGKPVSQRPKGPATPSPKKAGSWDPLYMPSPASSMESEPFLDLSAFEESEESDSEDSPIALPATPKKATKRYY